MKRKIILLAVGFLLLLFFWQSCCDGHFITRMESPYPNVLMYRDNLHWVGSILNVNTGEVHTYKGFTRSGVYSRLLNDSANEVLSEECSE